MERQITEEEVIDKAIEEGKFCANCRKEFGSVCPCKFTKAKDGKTIHKDCRAEYEKKQNEDKT